MKRLVLLFLAAVLLTIAQSSARAEDSGDSVLGNWHTTDNKSVVKIFKRYDHYFAKIISMGEPDWPADDKLGMGGKPRTDRNNPDPALRNRSLLGLEFMSGFTYSGKNHWADGKIYDVESGSTYHGKMTLQPDNKLELRGYIGISLIGRTVVWTR